ncbi:MAG: hypothetical protein FWG63_01920 [Defluviitaleaceae bacterium]|nr:hypothetical protein [Defluviitaleaceae bacterium]
MNVIIYVLWNHSSPYYESKYGGFVCVFGSKKEVQKYIDETYSDYTKKYIEVEEYLIVVPKPETMKARHGRKRKNKV